MSCALLLASSFMTSCEKDDDPTPDPEKSTYPEKVLISASLSGQWGYWEKDIAYDSKGRVVEEVGSSAAMCSPNYDTLKYTFSDNSFVGRSVSDDYLSSIIDEISGKINQSGYVTYKKTVSTFSYGLLEDNNEDKTLTTEIEYTYNDLGQMVGISETGDYLSSNQTIRWEDGNIVEISGSYSTTFTYVKDSKYENRGNLHFFATYFDFPDVVYGAANEYLPVNITTKYSDGSKESLDITYTFDEDGYPIEVTFDDIYRKFTWKKK